MRYLVPHKTLGLVFWRNSRSTSLADMSYNFPRLRSLRHRALSSRVLYHVWFRIKLHASCRLRGNPTGSELPPASIQDVGVVLSSFHVLMAEQLLDDSAVVAVFKNMRGEGVSEGMPGGPLDTPFLSHGSLDGALDIVEADAIAEWLRTMAGIRIRQKSLRTG